MHVEAVDVLDYLPGSLLAVSLQYHRVSSYFESNLVQYFVGYRERHRRQVTSELG